MIFPFKEIINVAFHTCAWNSMQQLELQAYYPPIKITLGGQRLSTQQLDDARKKQEREQQLDAKYAGVRRKVSYVCFETSTNYMPLVVVCIYLQQKHEEHQRAKRQKEDEEIQRKKQIQREKVSSSQTDLLKYRHAYSGDTCENTDHYTRPVYFLQISAIVIKGIGVAASQ